MKYLELLAPAKDTAHGIAAINHGADAVYIGAPMFGARVAASNSLEDLEQLVRYAHIFGSKVFARRLVGGGQQDDSSALQHGH